MGESYHQQILSPVSEFIESDQRNTGETMKFMHDYMAARTAGVARNHQSHEVIRTYI